MSLYAEYVDYWLGHPVILSPAKKIVFEIVKDMSTRNGLKEDWNTMTIDAKEQIFKKWYHIAAKQFPLI